ncbi:hypothetical protein S245_001830, partial [Arachis hypogaea]
WTAYLISILYVEYRTRKEKENVNFKNHVIQLVNFLAPLILLLLLSQFLVDMDKHLSYLIHRYLEE